MSVFVPKITNSSFEDLYKNINKYIDLFLEHGVIGFQKINLSVNEQKIITDLIGKKLNWNYLPDINYENHSYSIDRHEGIASKDKILINWHIEHLERVYSQIATSWNMLKFTCPKGSGNTGFIQSSYLYHLMPSEWQRFLDGSIITHYSLEYPQRAAVEFHRNSGKKILRMSPHLNEDQLILINESMPGKNDLDIFQEIKDWYCGQIYNNKSLPYWWEWSEGDFIIVDLLYVIHAVKGGFSSKEREFARIWAYTDKSHEEMYVQKNANNKKDTDNE